METNTMKYLKTYTKLFESKSSLKFTKQPSKKGAKTETYNVIKDGEVIGQIKWSSRMRGYAFLPEKEHDDEIKKFIKDLMNKRKKSKLLESNWYEMKDHIDVEKKEVKTNESTEEDVHREMMIKNYGLEEVEDCDEVIRNISDMALELEDLEINVIYGYTPRTLLSIDHSPKIQVSIIAYEKLFAEKIADIDIFTDTLLSYVRSLGFSTGKNTFTSDRKLNRQILIYKNEKVKNISNF